MMTCRVCRHGAQQTNPQYDESGDVQPLCRTQGHECAFMGSQSIVTRSSRLHCMSTTKCNIDSVPRKFMREVVRVIHPLLCPINMCKSTTNYIQRSSSSSHSRCTIAACMERLVCTGAQGFLQRLTFCADLPTNGFASRAIPTNG